MDKGEAQEYYMATVEQEVMKFITMANAGALSRDEIDFRVTALVTAAFATGWDCGHLSSAPPLCPRCGNACPAGKCESP